MKTNSMSETDLQARMQRIEDNLQMMHTYFDALFGKDLTPILEMNYYPTASSSCCWRQRPFGASEYPCSRATTRSRKAIAHSGTPYGS
jgi:hypothetical protein